MNKPVHYKGKYKRGLKEVEIIIENNFETLSTEIDGVKFSGVEFNDFAVCGEKITDKAQNFTFLSTPVSGQNTSRNTLCDCSFEIIIPQIIIDTEIRTEFESNLFLIYRLGKPRLTSQGGIDIEEIEISLDINGSNYYGKSGFIEEVFDQIYQQFAGRYKFKNCYGCMFSDYSVYGQSGFGSMHCYESQKADYLKVKTKEEYMINLQSDVKYVQEIYLCNKFEIRKKGTGYRG